MVYYIKVKLIETMCMKFLAHGRYLIPSFASCLPLPLAWTFIVVVAGGFHNSLRKNKNSTGSWSSSKTCSYLLPPDFSHPTHSWNHHHQVFVLQPHWNCTSSRFPVTSLRLNPLFLSQPLSDLPYQQLTQLIAFSLTCFILLACGIISSPDPPPISSLLCVDHLLALLRLKSPRAQALDFFPFLPIFFLGDLIYLLSSNPQPGPLPWTPLWNTHLPSKCLPLNV